MDALKPFAEEIKENCPETEIRFGEIMKNHTSFRIGGEAKIMLLPHSEEELCIIINKTEKYGIKRLVIGNGTNLLVADEGIDAAVIKISEGMSSLCLSGESLVKAGAGALLSRAAVFAMKNLLSGLEFAHGIPGSVGGAVYMNAGAYGGEMKDVIKTVSYITPEGKIKTVNKDECAFSYRRSVFTDTEKIVTSCVFSLEKGNEEEIKCKMDELMTKRRQSQPLNLPSAGSTFKRPETGYAAAMIDGAGLKGQGYGDARVSEKHAGFIVNYGSATFDDVIKTMELVRNRVYEKYGVELSPEVKIIR